MKLYWAYGSNLNVQQMRRRCPGATVVAPLTLPNVILRFRSVADVAFLRGADCPGGLWEITPHDEAILDRYEGVRPEAPAAGLYRKLYFKIELDGRCRKVLYYMMNEVGIMPPPVPYLSAIAQGYKDFGLPLERLQRAVDHSWRRRRKTAYLRWRHERKGAPKLARSVPGTLPPGTDQLSLPTEKAFESPSQASSSPFVPTPYVYRLYQPSALSYADGWYWAPSEFSEDSYGPFPTEEAATHDALRHLL